MGNTKLLLFPEEFAFFSEIVLLSRVQKSPNKCLQFQFLATTRVL